MSRHAIIGAGIMGADHARIFAEEAPGIQLWVICDAGAALYGADHAGDALATIACIKAGKRVRCEKPLPRSVNACQDVMQAELSAGAQFVQVCFMRRVGHAYVARKAALDQGLLGRALMTHNFHRKVFTPAADITGAMANINAAP